MAVKITSESDFKTKVKDANKDQLLIFHSNNSNPVSINRYNIVALSTAIKVNKSIEVFTINLDQVSLDPQDASTYQMGNQAICCTTINDGIVMEKQVNPFETTLRQMVLNILI